MESVSCQVEILPLTEVVINLVNLTIEMFTTQMFSWDLNFKDENARLSSPPPPPPCNIEAIDKYFIPIHGAHKAMGNGQQAILDTCIEKRNTDDSCAKEQVSITYGSVIWILCHMENMGPKYLAMDSVQEW